MRDHQSDRINRAPGGSAPVVGGRGSASSTAAESRSELADAAERALALRQHDPRAAIALAEHVLAVAGRSDFPEQRSVAERAIGLARKELNDLNGAERHLRRAMAAGRLSGSQRTLAMAQMS